MVEEVVVASPKALPVVCDRRRRHGRITEGRMPGNVWGTPFADIALSCHVAIMKTLLDNCRGWGRRVEWRRPRMRTPAEDNRRHERQESGPFLHAISSIKNGRSPVGWCTAL
jgi:hypothetical protein